MKRFFLIILFVVCSIFFIDAVHVAEAQRQRDSRHSWSKRRYNSQHKTSYKPRKKRKSNISRLYSRSGTYRHGRHGMKKNRGSKILKHGRYKGKNPVITQ